MKAPSISFSWLDGQLKAVSPQRGAAAAPFERTSLPSDFTGLAAVLTEAVAATQAEGKEACMVVAHNRLSHQMVELPPIKGARLETFLERKAAGLKTFEGDAAWSWQNALPQKNSNAATVHLLPKAYLNQLNTEFARSRMQLVRLVPAAAVLANQLKDLPIADDEVVVLAAETGSTTTVVVGRKDGRVCLVRVLRARWDQNPETIAIDLNRTIGFAEQEAGVTVASVWLFGESAAKHTPAIQVLLRQPVKLSPVACTPYYWAEQAGNLPDKDNGNFISLAQREAPMRQRLSKVTAVILFAALLVAIATAGFCELRRKAELNQIKEQEADLVKLQERKRDWEEKTSELERKKELVRVVSEQRVPPVPAWLLGYLAEALPDELALDSFRVARTNDFWAVAMSGRYQPPADQPPGKSTTTEVTKFAERLKSGPFGFSVSRNESSDANRTFIVEGEAK